MISSTTLHLRETQDPIFRLRLTILNMTSKVAEVWISCYFEEFSQHVCFIKTEVKKGQLRKINIVGEEVDDDALFINIESLKRRGIPENVPFAVRFMSNRPIVVSHKNHAASYHSAINNH